MSKNQLSCYDVHSGSQEHFIDPYLKLIFLKCDFNWTYQNDSFIPIQQILLFIYLFFSCHVGNNMVSLQRSLDTEINEY